MHTTKPSVQWLITVRKILLLRYQVKLNHKLTRKEKPNMWLLSVSPVVSKATWNEFKPIVGNINQDW